MLFARLADAVLDVEVVHVPTDRLARWRRDPRRLSSRCDGCPRGWRPVGRRRETAPRARWSPGCHGSRRRCPPAIPGPRADCATKARFRPHGRVPRHRRLCHRRRHEGAARQVLPPTARTREISPGRPPCHRGSAGRCHEKPTMRTGDSRSFIASASGVPSCARKYAGRSMDPPRARSSTAAIPCSRAARARTSAKLASGQPRLETARQ